MHSVRRDHCCTIVERGQANKICKYECSHNSIIVFTRVYQLVVMRYCHKNGHKKSSLFIQNIVTCVYGTFSYKRLYFEEKYRVTIDCFYSNSSFIMYLHKPKMLNKPGFVPGRFRQIKCKNKWIFREGGKKMNVYIISSVLQNL